MAIEIYPGDDDQYEDVDFSEPPRDEKEVAKMWQAIGRSVYDLDYGSENSG